MAFIFRFDKIQSEGTLTMTKNYRKYIIRSFWMVIILFHIFLLVGCNTFDKENQEVKEQSEQVVHDQKKQSLKSPEEVIEEYFLALNKQEFENIGPLLSSRHETEVHFLKEDIIYKLKNDARLYNYSYESYEIVELKEYDITKKYITIRVSGKSMGSKSWNYTQEIMLIKEENEWKIDFTLVVSKEAKDYYNVSNDQWKAEDFTVEKLINDKTQISFNFSSVMSDRGFFFGGMYDIECIVETDKLFYEIPLPGSAFNIGPVYSYRFNIVVDSFDGEIEKITIPNVRYSKDASAELNSEVFDIIIDINSKNQNVGI